MWFRLHGHDSLDPARNSRPPKDASILPCAGFRPPCTHGGTKPYRRGYTLARMCFVPAAPTTSVRRISSTCSNSRRRRPQSWEFSNGMPHSVRLEPGRLHPCKALSSIVCLNERRQRSRMRRTCGRAARRHSSRATRHKPTWKCRTIREFAHCNRIVSRHVALASREAAFTSSTDVDDVVVSGSRRRSALQGRAPPYARTLKTRMTACEAWAKVTSDSVMPPAR